MGENIIEERWGRRAAQFWTGGSEPILELWHSVQLRQRHALSIGCIRKTQRTQNNKTSGKAADLPILSNVLPTESGEWMASTLSFHLQKPHKGPMGYEVGWHELDIKKLHLMYNCTVPKDDEEKPCDD